MHRSTGSRVWYSVLKQKPRDLPQRRANFSTQICTNSASSLPVDSLHSAEAIKIPKRIERGPTDILRALAGTVGVDETAAHYKYVDDPFFLPSTGTHRRIFALSKESGRKAAQYLAAKFSPLFKYEQDEPRISKFRPALKPTDLIADELCTEATLLGYLKEGWTAEAMKVYEKIAETCSLETKLHFLEYLSFHNSQEPVETEFQEQSFYRVYYQSDRALKSVWKTDGLPMEIFRSLEDKNQRAYAAVICGMAKYANADDAFALFEELTFLPNFNVKDPCLYNHLLDCTPDVAHKPEEMWALVTNLLKKGASVGFRPQVTTFNSILAVIHRTTRLQDKQKRSLQVLREMKALDIEPSLATFYFLLRINEKRSLRSWLEFVMVNVENKTLKFSDRRDSLFFTHCARLIAEFGDKKMAYRLHSALNHSTNLQFLNDSDSEFTYFDILTSFLSGVEEPAVFMDFFDSVFPLIFQPSRESMLKIFENLAMLDGHKFFPRLYPSLLSAGYLKHSSYLVSRFVLLMSEARNVDFDTKRQFGDVAYDIKQKRDFYLQNSKRRDNAIVYKWTALMVKTLAKLCEDAGQIERSKEIAASPVDSEPSFSDSSGDLSKNNRRRPQNIF